MRNGHLPLGPVRLQRAQPAEDLTDIPLPAVRLKSLKALVAEEAALEEEQRVHERASDRRGVHKPRTQGRFA